MLQPNPRVSLSPPSAQFRTRCGCEGRGAVVDPPAPPPRPPPRGSSSRRSPSGPKASKNLRRRCRRDRSLCYRSASHARLVYLFVCIYFGGRGRSMKRRGGVSGGGGPRVIDASAGEPMAHGGRSPHSGLLARLPRYVKQLLLICSPPISSVWGLVSRPTALACPPRCGRRGPQDETRGGLGSEGGEGQARKEISASSLASVFPSQAGFVGGSARPGVASAPVCCLVCFTEPLVSVGCGWGLGEVSGRSPLKAFKKLL